MDKLTTFIIPTLDRNSLTEAINSVLAQTLKLWKCIIIYDGIQPEILPYYHPHIAHKCIVKSGEIKNNVSCAGKVRNLAFPLINTPWVSFLDDDDALNIFYLYWLNKYIKQDPELDCIIFTMAYADGVKHPNNYKDFITGDVGISFSVKMDFIKNNNILFENKENEDFNFLDKIRNAHGKIKISEQIMYYVRPYTHFPE